MKPLIVLTCCRGELLPDPGAAGVRENAIVPTSLLKSSSLSSLSYVMSAFSAVARRAGRCRGR